MSIYRTILEEELDYPGLDDNNCPELQEIEDVIADQDANAFEQDQAQAAEFGDGYGDADDILDESFFAIAEAEMNYNKMMMAIGVYELTESAAGREIIYEASSVKEFFTKAKNWVVSFFKKVWQVLQRFAANISATIRTNKSFIKKYKSQIPTGYAILNKDSSSNKMKRYLFKGLDKAMSATLWSEGLNNSSHVKTVIDKAKDFDKVEVSIDEQIVENTVRAFRKGICGVECDAGEFREKLHNAIYGDDKPDVEAEKVDSLMPVDEVIKVLESGADELKACRKAIDGAKKEYKGAIKKLNDIEASFARKIRNEENKGDKANEADKGSYTAKMNVATRMISLMKQVLTATQVARATILSAARSRIAQARRYGNAYVYAANKGNPKYKGFQKESAEYGFLSNLDLV